MSRKFEVGDRIRVLNSSDPMIVGETGTITGEARVTRSVVDGSRMLRYPVTLDVRGGFHNGMPICFRPAWIAPLYDGNEKVAWSSCAWRPTSVRV